MVEQAFHTEGVTIPLDRLEATRQLSKTARKAAKYRQMAASIREIGIIEPPIVFPHGEKEGSFLLLDGHVRVDILREMGKTAVFCLVAKDDEAFTFNRRVNRLATVQEHIMIRRALDRGVSEERLSRALGVDVIAIRNRGRLLDGIHPEVVERLKDRQIGEKVFHTLRRMKPLRQIEAVDRMFAANTFTETFVRAILAATPPDMLQPTRRSAKSPGMSMEQLAGLEKEMANLEQRSKVVARTLGLDTLTFSMTRRYVEGLLGNERVKRHLAKYHPDMLIELDRIIKIDLMGVGGI